MVQKENKKFRKISKVTDYAALSNRHVGIQELSIGHRYNLMLLFF